MSFPDLLAEDRRFIVLTTLDEATGYQANEGILQRALDHVGHRVGRDILRADLIWLQDHGLISVEVLGSGAAGFWIATLKEPGQAVAEGRLHPGIARPRAP